MADPTTWTNVGSSTSSTSATIPSLTPGTEYDFDIVASNSVGSATSAEVTTTTSTTVAPSPPTGLTVVSALSTSIVLSWQASATGTALITYAVQYQLSGQSPWTIFTSGLTSTTSTVTGLASAATYNFQIVASNVAGTATSATLTTSTLASQTPPAPATALTIGTVTTTSIVVTWSASASGSTPITYQLQERVTGQIAWTNVGTASASLTGTATGLLSGTSYDFQVVATNAAGSINSSVLSYSTISLGVAPSAPATLTITAVTPTSAALSWSASQTGSAPISYQPQYKLVAQTAWTNFGLPTAGLTTTITGLSQGVTYSFQVLASNAAGFATSPIQTAATTATGIPPSAPGTPVAWIITPTSVSLTWSVSAAGTAPITYQLQYRVSGQGSFLPGYPASSAVSGTISGLTPGNDYDFQVIAANASGVSYSNILTILAPIVGGTVTAANYQPNQVLTAEALDASFDAKLDVAGGAVGPLSITQAATGGGQPAELTLVRSAGGLGDSPLVSGSYTALMADGPIVPYASIGMSLTIQGDGSGNGPAGNVWSVWSALNINALRSTVATPSGSQHAALFGQVVKSAPATGVPTGRSIADGWAVYASAADASGLPSSQSGALSGLYAPVSANGRDDSDLRYAARIVYSEASPVSGGASPAEFSRGLSVGAGTSTTYAKVVVEIGGGFSSAGIDLRSASSHSGTITSATPGAAVTTLVVTNALAFASAGSPAAAVNATNSKAVVINGNPYNVVSVSLTPGSSSGTLTFASPVAAADAVQGGTVIPAAHSIWLSEGGSGALPGDIALNKAATSRFYYDATGGGFVIASGTDRVTLGSTAAVRFPVGNTAQRPASPSSGDTRFNSDIGQTEQWQPTTSTWVPFGSGTATPTSVPPGPATALVAATATSSAVPLSWSAPSTGSTPFTYQVQYQINGVSAWTNWGGTQSTLLTTVSGLTANTRYNFQIITTNVAGSSTSAVTSVTTLAVAPTAPTGVTVGSLTSTSATVAWTAPVIGTAPLSYTPQYRVTGSTAWSVGTVTTGTSQTISSLSAATEYDFEVIATNTGGSATSTITNATTSAAATIEPSAPTGVSATSPTSSSLVVAFSAPASGTTPFSYQVYYRVTGTPAWNAFGSAITTTSITVIGLNASTSYDFEVSATNSAGTSTSSVVTGITAATTPASTGTVSGTQTSGTSTPIISGPATGAVVTGAVLALPGIVISDPNAAVATGSCTLGITCKNGTLSSTLAGAQISGSGTTSITYANTLSACQTAAADLIYSAGTTAVSDNVVVSFTDQAGAKSSISVIVTVSLATGPGTGGTIPTDATGTTAIQAQKVLNGFGVNTHLDQTVYQTITLATVENCINYLGGIKLLRDGSVSASDTTWWPQVAQATNTQFIAYIPQGPQTSFQTYLSNNTAVASKYIAALEGCDEADTGAAVGYAETLAQAATFQQTVWNAGVTAGLPVIQLSCGQGYSTNPTSGNYGTVGNLSAYATYGNIHLFLPASPLSNWALSNGIQYEANLPTPGKPAALTEFGWTQQVSSSYNNVSPATAAAYILEMIFSAFNAGCPYYCWFSLLDDASSGPIGLFDSTGSPRQTATAVKNLFTLLSDTNSNALTFTPGKLNYTIANFPSNSGANGGYTTLLQQSSGVFWLAMWNDQPLNNTSTGADIAVAAITVTLTLGTTPISITVYDPSVSANPVQSASGVASLAISLPARVILVKIVHS